MICDKCGYIVPNADLVLVNFLPNNQDCKNDKGFEGITE